MTLAGFVTYAGALAIAAAIPGPGIVALIARALGAGFRPAIFMAAGLIVGGAGGRPRRNLSQGKWR